MMFAARPIAAFAAAALLGAACGSKDTAAPAPPDSREPAAAATTPAPAAPETASRFHRVLELQGVSFAVTCDNDSSINQLRIEPAGLGTDVQPVLQDVDGTVVGAEVGDLDVDGSPEVYVFVQSAGSGSYGSLVAYAVDNRKSLSAIDLPPVTENEQAAKGYMGHDDFAVVENRLVQRFPIYRDGDTNASPTGGTRQLQYKLTAGRTGRKLIVDRVVEY